MEAGGLGPRGVRSGTPAGSGVVRCRRRPRPPGVRRSRPPSAARRPKRSRTRWARRASATRTSWWPTTTPVDRVAARLWWMLHVTGHRAALLDLPSLEAWTAIGGALATGAGSPSPEPATLHCATLATRTDRRRRRGSGVADAEATASWWTPGRGSATGARSNRSTRWPATSRARSAQRGSATAIHGPDGSWRPRRSVRGTPTLGVRDGDEHDRLVRVGRHGVSGRAWRWSEPASPAPGCTRGPGRIGSTIHRDRSRPAPNPERCRPRA